MSKKFTDQSTSAEIRRWSIKISKILQNSIKHDQNVNKNLILTCVKKAESEKSSVTENTDMLKSDNFD